MCGISLSGIVGLSKAGSGRELAFLEHPLFTRFFMYIFRGGDFARPLRIVN